MSENDTPEVPEVEVQALEHGWQPEEDFKADPKNANKKWRSADEFMDRKSLFDKIEEQHKQIRDLKKGVDTLTQHNKVIEQSAYERAQKELRAERKQALADGDIAKAEELRDKIDDIKAQQQDARTIPQGQTEHPEFTQFKQVNPWYEKDVKMTAWADGMGALLARQGHTPGEVLSRLNKLAREEFPEKFVTRNPNKNDAPAVGQTSSKRTGADTFRLTADEEKVMNTLIRAGAKISPEEYKAQIKKSKGY
jgi:hypothetical protein